MAREEINEWANRNNNTLHCLRVMVGEEVCEECELYGTTGTDHCEADCVREAIEALECMKKIKTLIEMDNEQHTRSIKLAELKEVCGL